MAWIVKVGVNAYLTQSEMENNATEFYGYFNSKVFTISHGGNGCDRCRGRRLRCLSWCGVCRKVNCKRIVPVGTGGAGQLFQEQALLVLRLRAYGTAGGAFTENKGVVV